jgi:hypothetical protein
LSVGNLGYPRSMTTPRDTLPRTASQPARPPVAALRARLLAVATAGNAVAVAFGCLLASASSCSRGSDGAVASTSPIRPPTAPQPFDESAPAGSATAGTAPGTRTTAFEPCGLAFFVRKNPLASGGPYRLPACYAPVGRGTTSGKRAEEVCLAASSPRLAEAMPAARDASCLDRGPVLEPAGATTTADCCYVFGAMGEGRPLWVAVVARKERSEDATSGARDVARRSSPVRPLVRVVAKLAPNAWVSQNPAGVSPLS